VLFDFSHVLTLSKQPGFDGHVISMEVPMSGLGHCNKPEGMTEGDAKRGFSQAFMVLNRGNAPLLVEKLGFAAGNGAYTCEEGSLMFQPCGTCLFRVVFLLILFQLGV
jgi:hypothetical protein